MSAGCELILRDLPPKQSGTMAVLDGGQDASQLGPDGAPAHTDAEGEASGDAQTGSDASSPPMDDAKVPPPPGSDAAAGDGDDAGEPPEPDPDGCDGASERLFYRDGDDDGYGVTSTAVAACAPPSDGKWVELGEDCHDDEPDVNPGQTTYFAVGYRPVGDSLVLSFDYDCDGSETAGPGQTRAPTDCAGLLTCAGSGYAPNDERTQIPGLNAYCGSNIISTCKAAGLACQASETTTDTRYVCK